MLCPNNSFLFCFVGFRAGMQEMRQLARSFFVNRDVQLWVLGIQLVKSFHLFLDRAT